MKTITHLKRGIALFTLFVGIVSFHTVQSQNLISEPGFEAGSPNPFWSEASTNFGTPLCTIIGCGTGGGTGPHTGNWWAWFGGISMYEAGEINQTVIIPSGSAVLKFWLEIPASSGNQIDYLKVDIDGNNIFMALENTPSYYPYSQVVIDVSAYADGASHVLRFYSEIFGPGISNFFVDDVELIATQPSTIPINSWSIILAIGLIALGVYFRFRNNYPV